MDHSLLIWRKSSFSGNGDEWSTCVEVAPIPGAPRIQAYRGGPTVSGGFAVRDSKSSTPALTFATGPWTAFLRTLINS